MPFHKNIFWSHLQEKNRVYTGCRKNNITGMIATGIPPHIILANELVEVREELKNLKEEI
jgi:hypothetical protein